MERLVNEIVVLLRCQEQHKLSAEPIVRQLLADFARPNKAEPPLPQWIKFTWPKSGMIGDL